ncbi:LysR family transcriptional regulator [Aliivibrio salmonicida]|jgi:DNA-binding transcriptional LysR family regulator|uniref:HTH-type transciptional regulator, LysR-family n=1 Tax=Aliivibrio salmonicida (strain LFI1238) TaxID=316275 RepID=B6EGE7_ALISL|nr:LysR substrate-binding domain-containing protein [Aliivibrio salmonicida]AZL84084.1 LysR family transcriptional regulator [Aliivibrio salmonicida]CAQ78363.1 HTH-type transciptional regulator, LysR-family [Aliivibrio salmonicida LFI1238]
MRISLKQLNVFTAIAQEKTMTKAAERLFITKPAVSLSLSELEKNLGYKVFDRVNNRLVLNSEGRQLLPLADELLERAEAIEHQFTADSQLTGSLNIGASDTIGNHIAPVLLSKFQQQHPCDIQQLFISNTAQIINRLLEFKLDIGLVEGKAHHPKLNMIEWQQDDMYIVCAPSHPLAMQNIITLEDLEHSTWLLREEGSGSREYFLNHIASNLNDWHESLQLHTTEAIINCCSENMGLACLSQLAAQNSINDGRLVQLPYEKKLTRPYWLLVHKEKYQTPLLQYFMTFIQR